MPEKTKQQDKVILACRRMMMKEEDELNADAYFRVTPHNPVPICPDHGTFRSSLFPWLPTAQVHKLHSSPKSRLENTVFRSSPSMQLCPWFCTWNTRVTLDSSLGSSRNFRPRLCKLVVLVMFSTSQSLFLAKMSRGYISTPPPYRWSTFKYTSDYRSAILAFSSIMLQWFPAPNLYLKSHTDVRSIKATGTRKTIQTCSLSLR